MAVSETTFQLVRERAEFRCEYCGVSEDETGGILTIDHYRPLRCDGRVANPALPVC
jgi:hypothetical protein